MKRTEYEKRLKYLQDELENLKKVDINEDEFPRVGCTYYFVDGDGSVNDSTYDNDNIDWYRKNFMGIYETKDECVRARNIKKEFKKASLQFNPDWEDNDECKWYIYFNHILKRVEYKINTEFQRQTDYFASKEVLEELVNKFGEEDVKKYYLGVKD